MIHCIQCQAEYPENGFPYLCERCGGIFDFEIDATRLRRIHPDGIGLWKYREAFELPIASPFITLGEGDTPLNWIDLQGKRIGLKLEFLNPTGSYKDRGSAVLASHLAARGIKEAVEDSSGNAGASFAAYATRAGIKGRIFIPESASGPKRAQIEWYGAEVIRIPGSRSEASKAVLNQVHAGAIYASHAYQPFGLAGIATIAYELIDQAGEEPGTIIAPVGHGGLLYGILKGFQALKSIGKIQKMPYFIGVQAAACDPIVRMSNQEENPYTQSTEIRTIAEGVKVINPSRGDALVQNLANDNGEFLAISDVDIKRDHLELAKRGYYVEPTSALAWSAVKAKIGQVPEPIIAVLTGSGLKYS